MALQITLVKTPTKVSVSKTSQTFHKQGGSLGRGESNVWVLPDPDKFLSSCHCEVLFDANKYYLLDLSTNGTFFNGSPEPLGKGVKSPLADGDMFEVGEYRFAVKVINDENFASASPFAAPKPSSLDIFAGAGQSGSLSGFAQPFAAQPLVGGGFLPSDYNVDIDSQGIDPIALWDAVEKKSKAPLAGFNPANRESADTGPMFDPVTGAIVSHKPFSGTATDHSPSVDQAITWPTSKQENLIPENWDDMDLLSSPPLGQAPVQPFNAKPQSFNHAAPPSHQIVQPFNDPLQNWDEEIDFLASPPLTQPGSEQPFNKPPVESRAEQMLNQGHGFVGVSQPASLVSRAAPGGTHSAQVSPVSPLEGAVQAPVMAVTAAEPLRSQLSGPATSQAGAISSGVPNNRLIAAMGLDAARLSAEQMDEISGMVGELMRETVSGMMQVLRSRTSIKNEFRMNVTTIQPVENNPLKFSVTVDDALENMFIKKSNAYKKPVEALREGFQEIGEHQLAMIAGIRQGFEKMMQRFDPEHLEHTFNKQGKGSLIPGMQKTKYWSNYCDHYAGFVDNMESSFQHLFGSDFVSAYEEQLRKLAAARKK